MHRLLLFPTPYEPPPHYQESPEHPHHASGSNHIFPSSWHQVQVHIENSFFFLSPFLHPGLPTFESTPEVAPSWCAWCARPPSVLPLPLWCLLGTYTTNSLQPYGSACFPCV